MTSWESLLQSNNGSSVIRHSFHFSFVRMSDKSSNVPSNIVYSDNGGESLRIARASNNPESFSIAIKLLTSRWALW